MTREEAIKLLKGKAYVFYGEMQLKALGMAIEALQQQRQEILPKHLVIMSLWQAGRSVGSGLR